MKKRILIIAAILLAIALLCVCILPIKTEINLSLPGGRIDYEANVISEEPIIIRGWLRNYLLRDDTMELHITYPDLTARTDSENTFWNYPYESFIRQNYSVYVSEWNRGALVQVCLAKDCSWYLVRIENRLFYGSNQGGPTPAEIIAITGMTR